MLSRRWEMGDVKNISKIDFISFEDPFVISAVRKAILE